MSHDFLIFALSFSFIFGGSAGLIHGYRLRKRQEKQEMADEFRRAFKDSLDALKRRGDF